MSLRAIETIFVQIGVPRKKLLKRAAKLMDASEARIVRTALDEFFAKRADRYPQLVIKNGAAKPDTL